MSRYLIKDDAGSRPISPEAFPLAVGGEDGDLNLPGSRKEPLAWMGLDDDQVFIQPVEGETVEVNGAATGTSHWLKSGDVLGFGATRVHVEMEDDVLCFHISPASAKAAPVLTPPPKPAVVQTGNAPETEGPLKPAAFKPNPIVEKRERRSFFRPSIVAAWLVLLILGVVAGFLFLSKSVAVAFTPHPDQYQVHAWPSFSFGERRLMLPGTYEVTARKSGHHPYRGEITVNSDPRQDFQFDMEKLPGLLKVKGLDGAQVTVDGEALGSLPADPFSLEAGEHQILVQAPRHKDFTAKITMEGMGQIQELEVELIPRWAPVTFRSQPAGADVYVGSLKIGRTPVVGDIGEGDHRYELRMQGFKAHRGDFQVSANQPLKLPSVPLIPADGTLKLTSQPSGAMASINGQYAGTTPLSMVLPPNKTYTYRLYKGGHEARGGELNLSPGAEETRNAELPVLTGELTFNIWPSGAELLINQKVVSQTGSVTLPAVPQDIEIHKDGFLSFKTTITPMPEYAKMVDVELTTLAEAKAKSTPTVLKAGGHSLRLIKPGRFHMGASRREPGRRANETYREVELTRAYYLGTHEVSNAQFKRFLTSHESGNFQSNSLDGGDQPVVNITWKLAASYCNWLSEQEGLAPFYVKKDGVFVPAEPKNNGYRLPTEAEWAWAARFAGGAEPSRKYPWGPKMPVPPDSGNYADITAGEFLPGVLKNYNDKRAVTAPVGDYLPNPLGIYSMGGNVAEWVHDFYNIRSPGKGRLEKDPFGDSTGKFRVIRGSSWQHSTITELRLTFRDYGEKPRPDLGFRIARYVE